MRPAHYSPLRYAGGKSWLVPHLRSWLSCRPRPAVFVEPFAGGGSLACAVALEALADHVILSELDERVAAVWQVVFSEQADALAELILAFPLNAETVASLLNTSPGTPLERALQVIVHNRVSRAGILAPGAGLMRAGENGRGLGSRWYPATLARRIRALGAVRDRVTVQHADALRVLPQYAGRTDVCVFLDPPYTAGGKRAGQRLYTHHEVDHERLFQLAAEIPDVLMTYDDAPEIHTLTARYGFQTRQIAMTTAHHSQVAEILIGRHLIWRNHQ